MATRNLLGVLCGGVFKTRYCLMAFAAAVVLSPQLAAPQSRVGGPQPSPRDPSTLAITHVSVVDTATGTANADMTIVVRGDRIVSVEKSGAAPAGARVIDGRGKFAIPGLWDMHSHVTDSRASALPTLVATGVLYVRDAGSGDLTEIDQWRGQIESNAILGPTIFRAGITLNGQESNRFHLVIANAEEARTAARTLKKIGVDILKTHRRTSRDAYFALADEARKIGVPLIGHVPMTVTPAEASDAGQQTIEHVETLFEGTFASAHNGRVTAAAIAEWRASPDARTLFEKFVRNRTVVDPTLVATGDLVRTFDSPNPDPHLRYVAKSALLRRQQALATVAVPQQDDLRARLIEHQKVTLQMQRAGVTLVTGTDAAYLHPPGFSLHDELDLMTEAGLTPAEILRAATINCAQLFPSIEAGAIAAGKRADVVLLNKNPLSDIKSVHDINTVVLRGRVLNRSALDRTLADAIASAAAN
jgi:imidazolonepropionase-like amidohydrolase